jgi:hypothetical protein
MMWVLRRSSSSATSLLREHDHFLFQALRVQLGLHVGEAVEDFWRWVASICGTSSRRVTTSSSMEVRRSLISRASSRLRARGRP